MIITDRLAVSRGPGKRCHRVWARSMTALPQVGQAALCDAICAGVPGVRQVRRIRIAVRIGGAIACASGKLLEQERRGARVDRRLVWVGSGMGTQGAIDAGLRWFLVQIKPNAFQIAERNLCQQKFAVFAPRLVRSVRRMGRVRVEPRPLFPGYLFVGFAPETAPYRAINATHGVTRLVQFGASAPAEVPAPIITGLMARCDAEARLLPPKALQAGTEVQLIGGPFADFVAAVESMAPDQRVWVLLDCMGQKTRVAVKVASLRER